MRSRIFTDLYKELEDTLESKYSGQKRRYSSVIYEYINSAESKPIREELDLCREIRNLLTHSANIGGVSVVEPSEPMIETLRRILEYVRRPPLALEMATPAARIMSAKLTDKVLSVMAEMDKRGYSYIPVMDKRRFLGVFSASAVFAYVLRNPANGIAPEMTVGDIMRTAAESANAVHYVFAGRETTEAEARRLFEKVEGRGRRLSVVFITEHGKKEEGLLGMLTPWDLMREE